MSVLLDTHFWIWWLIGDPRLRVAERDALDEAARSGGLRLSAISLWEAQMLHAKGRLELPVPFDRWIRLAADPATVTVLAPDVDVVLALDALPPGFHGDPADRVIVATSRAHGIPLATRDATIRGSRAVRLWRP